MKVTAEVQNKKIVVKKRSLKKQQRNIMLKNKQKNTGEREVKGVEKKARQDELEKTFEQLQLEIEKYVVPKNLNELKVALKANHFSYYTVTSALFTKIELKRPKPRNGTLGTYADPEYIDEYRRLNYLLTDEKN